MKNKIKFFGKIIILLLLSALIHFLPKQIKFSGLELFAPTSESVFQHEERILFVAYFIYSIIEYFIVRKSLKNSTSFWMSRFLIMTLFPWVMIMVFLLPLSFTGKMPTKTLEALVAILATSAVWLTVVPLEKDFASIKYSKTACVILTLFFLFTYFIKYNFYLQFTGL